jgi:CheY-like chemotaxis protein
VSESTALRKRVLVIDDDDDLREVMADLLREAGYDVDAAFDGVDACTRLAGDAKIDLILLDVMMPRMDGVTFRRWQLQSPHAAIPVVVATAAPRPPRELVEGAMQVDHAVLKPFDIDALLSAVQGLLR